MKREAAAPAAKEIVKEVTPASASVNASAVDVTARSRAVLRHSVEAQAEGNAARAKEAYDIARREAAEGKVTRTTAARAALSYARTLEGKATSEGIATPEAARSRLPEIKATYQEAITLGTPAERIEAQNNLAVFSLRAGEPENALRLLESIDAGTLGPEERQVYDYNYARALEQSGKGQEAYERYVKVLQKDPAFEPAITGAFRVLRSSSVPRVREAAQFAISLLAKGQQEPTGEEVRQTLGVWSGAQQLLAVLLEYYRQSNLTLANYRGKESPWLRALAKRNPSLAPAIKEITVASEGEMPILVDPQEARLFFPAWSGGSSKKQFSSFLKMVGDWYDHDDKPRPALARYAAAWAVNPANTDAALYAAVILSDHSLGLDPTGRLLDRLTQGLFIDKEMAYQRSDWVNILRLHTVLGTIFENQERWGPPGDSHSAIFQWTHALRAEDEVRRENPEFPPSPGLYLHLGASHERLGDAQQAWKGYVRASTAFLKASKPEDASRALERARSLPLTLSPSQEGTIHQLEQEITRRRG
jgi:tetratricopeptide (TPR) repeat protein